MNLCREKTGREDASQHATTKKCLSATPRARKTAGQQREDPRRLECHFALFRNRPPVANTVWTWYRIATEQLGFFLFFFSLARRTDAAHALWASAMQARDKAREKRGIPQRQGAFNALATAEMTIIALHRCIRMVYALVEKFCPELEVPDSVIKIQKPVEEMRHAFEHIDERAEGKVGPSAKTHPEALTIFNQPDFVHSSILRYREHVLDLETKVIAALLDSRELIMCAIDARAARQGDDQEPKNAK